MPEGGVGAGVRRARLAAGLTQRDLADRAGISVGALRDVEQGRTARPKPASIGAIATALGLVVAELDAATGGEPDSRGPTAPAVAVRLLGPMEIETDGRRRPVDGRGQAVTLGLLGLHVGEYLAHDVLADRLWPFDRPGSWAVLLRSYVARLRRRLVPLGADITGRPGHYRLSDPRGVCDVTWFVDAVRRADATSDPEVRARTLAEALGLWSDAPWSGLAEVSGHPRAVAWERERTRAAVACGAASLAGGSPERAAAVLAPLAAADPLDEALAASTVEVLVAVGRMADAHAVFARTRRALADELGLDPGPRLAEVYAAALRRADAAAPAEPSPPTGHAADRPLPAVEPVGRVRPAQLPRAVAVLHGRDADVAATAALLGGVDSPAPAVVVVSGMGGVGKTTFALAVAHAAAPRFPDGQLFVDLDGVGEPLQPATVLEQFLAALGHERTSLPGPVDELAAAFRTATAASRYLVVLDNASDSEQVEPLLPGGPGCGVLVTSRRSLADLDDAHRVSLTGLDAAAGRDLLAAGVGRDRVELEDPAAREIVAWCGGLPLALRIVVARLVANPSWRLADVARMLGDEHRRLDVLRSGSRAVRASFDLSRRALPAPTAKVFRLASVVPGLTFSAAAVEVASGVGDTVGALDDLVDRGLLASARGGRYRFHDLVRDYAAELAAAEVAERDAARQRLLRWLEDTAFAATALLYPHRVGHVAVPGPTRSPDLRAPEVVAAGEWLDAERETVVAAVHAAAAWAQPTHAWHLADAATGAMRRGSGSHEWERVAVTGLRAALESGDARAEGLMHESTARAFVARCDHARAVEHYARARSSAQRSGWRELEVSARENLGISLLLLGRQDEAVAEFTAALQLAEATGQRYWQAACHNDLGNVTLARGRVADAEQHYRRALAMNEELGDELGRFVNLANLAHVERLGGRPDAASVHVNAALENRVASSDRVSYLEDTIIRSEVELDLGRPEVAFTLATQALGWATRWEQGALGARARLSLARVHLVRDDPGRARRSARDALELTRRVGVPEYAIEAHLVLAETELAATDPDRAARHAAAARALAERVGDHAGVASADLARARVLLGSADTRGAGAALAAATTAFAACGHGRGLAQATALRAALDRTA